jgi:hypothetical protein
VDACVNWRESATSIRMHAVSAINWFNVRVHTQVFPYIYMWRYMRRPRTGIGQTWVRHGGGDYIMALFAGVAWRGAWLRCRQGTHCAEVSQRSESIVG